MSSKYAKYREKQRIASLKKGVRYKNAYKHTASNDTEGFEAIMGWQWRREYDKNIDQFWARRGMTEQESRIKWGSQAVWRRAILASRRPLQEEVTE